MAAAATGAREGAATGPGSGGGVLRRGGRASPAGPRARRAGGLAVAPPRLGAATSSPDSDPLRAVISDVRFRGWPIAG